MNCENNCPRAYKSPQCDKKCILPHDDKSSVMLTIKDGIPQKHWLCQHSSKSMKLSTVDKPTGFILNVGRMKGRKRNEAEAL